MDVRDIYGQSIAQATAVIDATQTDDFAKPTPDTEWNVQALAAHMLYELSWTSDILQGKTIAEVGNRYDGDLMAGNLGQAWHAAYDRALQALQAVDLRATVHLSYDDVAAEDYLWEAATDQLVHAWDLGQGIGLQVTFAPELAEILYKHLEPHKDTLAASGLFAPPIQVSENANAQTKLLGLTGRRA